MSGTSLERKFRINEQLLSEKFGPDSFIVSIYEGDAVVYRSSVQSYQVLETVSLRELGGKVIKFIPVKWEDGITRTQRLTELVTNGTYKVLIGAPLSKAA